jgi:hypothetical protein
MANYQNGQCVVESHSSTGSACTQRLALVGHSMMHLFYH